MPAEGGPTPPPPASEPEVDPRPEPSAERPPEQESVYFCDLCGAQMLDRHCKLVCPGCGYQRDCSDP